LTTCILTDIFLYPEWRLITIVDAKNGIFEQLPTYLDTKVRWLPPKITAIPEGAADGITDPVLLKSILSKLVIKRAEDVFEQTKLERKFYAFLWSRLSKQSQDAVSVGTEKLIFVDIERAADPYRLYDLIVEKVLVNPSGNPEMKAWDRLKMENKFGAFKQTMDMSIHILKTKYDNWGRNLTAMGTPTPSEEIAALGFLNRLDPTRYELFSLKLENEANMPGGKAPYQTVKLMYEAASKYKVVGTVKPSAGEPPQRAYMYADNVRKLNPFRPQSGRTADPAPQVIANKKTTQAPKEIIGDKPSGGTNSGKRKRGEDGEWCVICRKKTHNTKDCSRYVENYVPKERYNNNSNAHKQRGEKAFIAIGEYDDCDYEVVNHSNFTTSA
jgi:hypothetical protein